MRTRTPASIFMLTLLLAIVPAAYAHDNTQNNPAEAKDESYWCEHDCTDKLWSKLPEQKRKLLHNAMEKARAENEALHAEIHKLNDKLDALLAEPVFDKSDYLRASRKLDELRVKIKANMEIAFASVAGQFTAEERKILVKLHEIRHHNAYGRWQHPHDAEESDQQKQRD